MLKFTDKVVGEVTYEQTKKISETDVETIMVGAIEGGINYWAGVSRDEHWIDKPSDEPASTWIAKLLLDGNAILLYDVEDSSERWTLTLTKLLEGIKLNGENRPHDSDLEYGDATTYDCIVQYALFGEIVFG